MPDNLPNPDTNAARAEAGKKDRSSGWSGKYIHNVDIDLRLGTGGTRGLTEREPHPIYNVKKPIYKDDNGLYPGRSPLPVTRATLHVDIDNTDPLNVVSICVEQKSRIFGFKPMSFHVIGKVVSNKGSSSERRLMVENLHFIESRPNMIRPVKLEVDLSRVSSSITKAEVIFRDSQNRSFKLVEFKRVSTYFREVEVEIDRDMDDTEPEPYDTHLHPDRPGDLPREKLTIESAFAKSGIRIIRSDGSGIIDASAVSGEDSWTDIELHDAMVSHWSAFANKPQWKMWILLTELPYQSFWGEPGGMMFDADIDEPGGVDRQGAAIFTRARFHRPDGDYCQANPPADKAAQRELFFNLIHESGHTFNLAHPHDMNPIWAEPGEDPWHAPLWMPFVTSPTDPEDYTWMNYPDWESGSDNVKSFYDHFRFRFNDAENLFLRHAPAGYVQMGNEEWYHNHARVSEASLDRRLELIVRNRKPVVELGEPVFIELRLRNASDAKLKVHDLLNPGAGWVQLAITNPRGQRRPYIPIVRPRIQPCVRLLDRDKRIYSAVNLTMGRFGFPFKEPGPYRIEASYRNLDGRTAAAVMQLWVKPASRTEDLMIVKELFNARIGRALIVGGSRFMKDVNEKIDWVCSKLEKSHPARYYLNATRVLALAKPFKELVVDKKRIEVKDGDPETVVRDMEQVVEDMPYSADAIGHILYRHIVDTYVMCAAETKNKDKARAAKKSLLDLFTKRNVISSVIQQLEEDLEELN